MTGKRLLRARGCVRGRERGCARGAGAWGAAHRRLLAAAFAVCATVLLQATHAAALVDCSAARRAAPGEGPGFPVFKLLLDDLVVPASLGDADILQQSLLAKLQDNFDKARLELGRFHVVLCAGRRPSNVSDISGSVEGFTNSAVALETWGVFDGDEAILSHAIVPLMSDRADGWRPGDVHFVEVYQYDGSGELRFLKRLVNTSLEVRIYAAIGAASAAYIRSDFDSARHYFCRSLLMMREFGGGASANLHGFLENISARVIDEAIAAHAAGTYDGPLGGPDLPAGTPCGEIS